MGSGMLPVNAHVVHETEPILVFRKGSSRVFSDSESILRKESALFFRERNSYYRGAWEIQAIKQKMLEGDLWSGGMVFPIEIPFRLVRMFSIYGDTVFDPFSGQGNTSVASAVLGRNSAGFELDRGLLKTGSRKIRGLYLRQPHYMKDTFMKYIKSSEGEFSSVTQGYNVWHPHEDRQEFYYLKGVEMEIGVDKVSWDVSYEKEEDVLSEI